MKTVKSKRLTNIFSEINKVRIQRFVLVKE